MCLKGGAEQKRPVYLVCRGELKLDYFRRLPRSGLERALLGSAPGCGCQHRMTTNDKRSFYRTAGPRSPIRPPG